MSETGIVRIIHPCAIFSQVNSGHKKTPRKILRVNIIISITLNGSPTSLLLLYLEQYIADDT